MELSSIKRAKTEAEEKIFQAISNALVDFTTQTGLSCTGVNVTMIRLREHQDKKNTYLPASVRCEIDYDED